MFRQPRLFYSPDDTGGVTPPIDGVADILSFLKDDEADEPEVVDLDKKEKDKTDEKSDTPSDDKEKDEEEDTDEEKSLEAELKELEDDLEEPDEEKLELVTPVRRAEILKKYPAIFKDFPYLEKAYYREQQFTEVFPTIPDAKLAAEKATTLDNFESDLLAGNTEKMLQAAKTEPKAFNKLVDNYLGTLAKVDEKAYHHVLGNVISHTIASMVREAKASDNDALRNAAAILNQFTFGSSEYVPPKQLSSTKDTEENPREKELEERERKFETQRRETASNDLHTRINNSYKATIEAHIDPKDSMGEYTKRNAVRDASDKLDEMIKKDTRLKTIVDKLWDKAKKENYSKSSLDTIRSAYLSKARTLLPTVIKQARNEALKGTGKRVVNTDDKGEKPQRNRTEQPRSTNNKGNDKIPAGMSTLDFLKMD